MIVYLGKTHVVIAECVERVVHVALGPALGAAARQAGLGPARVASVLAAHVLLLCTKKQQLYIRLEGPKNSLFSVLPTSRNAYVNDHCAPTNINNIDA